jgi:transcriptional regulator of acetoin/glycerol metabolism
MVKRSDSAEGLRRAREQFLSAGVLDASTVAPGVLNSWRRSRDLHVHPDRVDLPYVRDPDTDTPLVHAAAPVLQRIANDLAAQAVSVVLTSAVGVVLVRVAADATLLQALDDVRLARGYSYAEAFTGTNGIGTTLETAQPTFIRGSEHYLGTLDRLSCAGSPIRDPITGRMIGVVDLTCWAHQCDPLLFVLAKAAGSQIEDRIGALKNQSEAALLECYLKHTRRYPGGVVAIGGDVVLMNPYLRQTLDAADQKALLDHAADLTHDGGAKTVVATLPSGATARISTAEQIETRRRSSSVVLHVHMQQHAERPAVHRAPQPISGVAGRSSSWRRSGQQVERCYRDRDWVVLEGESGTGRTKLAQAVVQHVSPERAVRVFRLGNFDSADDFITEIDAETDDDDFAVVLSNIDELPAEVLSALAAVLQTRAGRGWIAATVGSGAHRSAVDILVLPFFTHTVTVAPLRHRPEDLEELVPLLLKDLTRGADAYLAPEAMRQLSRLPWPGNVTQLRNVLNEAVALQRCGMIGIDKLPPECRSVAGRRLTQLEAIERDAIVRCLQENDGSKAAAAKALGMSRATIYRKIKEFGIA